MQYTFFDIHEVILSCQTVHDLFVTLHRVGVLLFLLQYPNIAVCTFIKTHFLPNLSKGFLTLCVFSAVLQLKITYKILTNFLQEQTSKIYRIHFFENLETISKK